MGRQVNRLNAEERAKFILWLLDHKNEIADLTATQVGKMATAALSLNGKVITSQTARNTMKNCGLAFRVEAMRVVAASAVTDLQEEMARLTDRVDVLDKSLSELYTQIAGLKQHG